METERAPAPQLHLQEWPAVRTSGADAPDAIIMSSGISLRLWRLYAYFWLVCLLFPILALAQMQPTPVQWFITLAGLLIFGGWMLVLAAFDAGPGDVKLAAGIGWWLAWMSWWVFLAGVAAALLGMAGTLMANRWFRDRPRSPLGPGIVAGLLIGVLATAWLN